MAGKPVREDVVTSIATAHLQPPDFVLAFQSTCVKVSCKAPIEYGAIGTSVCLILIIILPSLWSIL